MSTYRVLGGRPLKGKVKVLGAKNSSFKLMIASLLTTEEVTLHNVPKIRDVLLVKELIESLGGSVEMIGQTLKINPSGLNSNVIKKEFGSQTRATSMFTGPLLARFGEIKFPLPGGDKIGTRPIDRHLLGFRVFGAEGIESEGMITLRAPSLRGGIYRFSKNSHTGTESLIMTAVKATGKTIIENAAAEPEVDDLMAFLNSMGAKIQRTSSRTIEIEGVEELHGTTYEVMPDRNEIVTFAIASLITKGECTVEGIRSEAGIDAFLQKLKQAYVGLESSEGNIRFFYQGRIRATNVITQPHPGFMTDWQPLWTLLMVHATGESLVHETVFESRWGYLPYLKQMGAQIEQFSPQVVTPEEYYNFNWTPEEAKLPHAIKIKGPRRLKGTNLEITDIRAGATVLIASLAAEGESVIKDEGNHIERGYDHLAEKLRSLGGRIEN